MKFGKILKNESEISKKEDENLKKESEIPKNSNKTEKLKSLPKISSKYFRINCYRSIKTTTKKVTKKGPIKDFKIKESNFLTGEMFYAPIIKLFESI